MFDLMVLIIGLILSIFLFFLMWKMHKGQHLFQKNNNIYVGDEKVEKKIKYNLNEVLVFILIIMLISLLTVSVISKASSININNASSASITINESQSDQVKVNLNNATLKELMTLPGIGEVKGNKIIEYRDKKRFESVSELLNIIGETTYNNIKNNVTTD